MNKQIEALKMAEEFMRVNDFIDFDTYKTIKEALAEAEQKEKQKEAFAEMVKLNQEMGGYEAEKQEPVKLVASGKSTWVDVKPTWQSLSDDEIEYLECLKAPPVHPDFINDDSWYEFARAIEQALKEKNYDLHKG